MSELYIFSQNDELLTIITEDTGLVSAPVRIEVNSVPDTPFSFTVEADAENAEYVKEENKAVYRDHEGDLRLVVIKELDDSDSMEGPLTTATCEPEFMELAETFVLDRRFTDRTAQFALDAALEHTGWIGEVEVELGLASTNFYRLRVIDSIWEIIATWGGEFKDVVEFDEENNIISRKIKIIQRLGVDIGQRFEIDHNITEIGRTVLSYPVTAMYGWGASLETDGGGHTRYIDFADVEWKKGVNGAPVDKPKGQKWVGDPEAFEKYKRFRGDKWIHRYGEFSNQDYEDPEELLWATWQNLQENKQPEVNYRLSVDLFDDKVSLGDTAIAIDRYFSRPIEIQARIIAMEYDLLDIDGTMVIEMGQFLNLHDDRLDKLEEKVDKVASRPQKVTENSYPDRKPSTPVNLEAYGGFETIQLYWDYADEIFIKHYEVYGSQVADFVPDSQHLLWRGQVSAFGHTVNTDETWYYYVRAVNYHGTPSDWSEKVSANTRRIISDDILFGEELAERLRDLSEISQIIADGTVDLSHLDNSIIEGNRIRGDLIALDGTSYIAEGVIGTAAIANGAIENFHLGRGIIGEAQIEDLAVTSAKIHSVDADKVNATSLQVISAHMGTLRSGRLLSDNNNMDLNLNTGYLTMQNANLTIANGANINFEDAGNTLTYRKYDSADSITRSAGLGVGDRIGGRYPFAYLGTTGASDLNSLSPYFSGFIANSTAATGEDNAANSVNGWRFQMRSTAVDWVKGITFDFNGSRPSIMTISPSSYAYDIGTFGRLYGRQSFGIVNYSNERSGWLMETAYAGNNTDITFRGNYSSEYNYQIGGNSSSNAIRNIYLRNNPIVVSDRRAKEDIADNVLGLDFIKSIDTRTFRLRQKPSEKERNKLQFGFIAQELIKSLTAHNLKIEDYSIIGMGEDGLYNLKETQLISPTIKAVQELDKKLEEEINWQQVEYQHLNNEATKINNEIAQLRKEHKEMKEEIKELREMVA